MYNVDQILSASRNKTSRLITSEEAFARGEQFGTIIVLSSAKHSAFFFTNDHCFGYPVLPDDFVPSTSVFPMQVVARPGLEDGIIATIEDFIKIFERDRKQLNTIVELVDLLNKEQE